MKLAAVQSNYVTFNIAFTFKQKLEVKQIVSHKRKQHPDGKAITHILLANLLYFGERRRFCREQEF